MQSGEMHGVESPTRLTNAKKNETVESMLDCPCVEHSKKVNAPRRRGRLDRLARHPFVVVFR